MQAVLILDACVLIDYANTDRELLRLFSEHLGPVHVAAPVLAEVDQLDEAQARALGIHVIFPELDLALQAAKQRERLSFQDWLCLLLAQHHSWTCVSNDARLRKACELAGVPILWGLELLERLVAAEAISKEDAITAAHAIHESNSFISAKVIRRFERKLAGPR